MYCFFVYWIYIKVVNVVLLKYIYIYKLYDIKRKKKGINNWYFKLKISCYIYNLF